MAFDKTLPGIAYIGTVGGQLESQLKARKVIISRSNERRWKELD